MERRLILRVALGAPALGLLGAALPRMGRAAPGAPPSKPRLIVIDPGHGGRDPGAVGEMGTLEKDITLSIALDLRDRLHERRGVRVLLTRERDEYLPLADRVQAARAAGAHFFVSLHADSAPNREARGLSAYTVAEEASDEFAQLLARQENLADRFAGNGAGRAAPDLDAILRDLRARHTREAALRARARLVAGAGRALQLLDNPQRSANFAVLRAPDIPSVLIETGFLSNREDERMLRDPDRRRRIADVLAAEFRGLMENGILG